MQCQKCQSSNDCVSALASGEYFSSICRNCLGGSGLSSGAQSHERRMQYDDHAQDTIQPYDANGKPRAEFYRMYPQSAEKVFTKQEVDSIKRQL